MSNYNTKITDEQMAAIQARLDKYFKEAGLDGSGFTYSARKYVGGEAHLQPDPRGTAHLVVADMIKSNVVKSAEERDAVLFTNERLAEEFRLLNKDLI